jgi:hypothetical protein
LQRLKKWNGWEKNRFVVIVIDPELEAWMWQDNPHIAKTFGFDKSPSLRDWLCSQGLWPLDSPKPPKLAFEKTLKVSQAKIPSVVFKKICSSVSLRRWSFWFVEKHVAKLVSSRVANQIGLTAGELAKVFDMTRQTAQTRYILPMPLVCHF